ncbi:hypothetical protein JCM3774_000603 [Rhodotorula dairenensis]
MARNPTWQPLKTKTSRKWDDFLDKVVADLRTFADGMGKFPTEWAKYASSKDPKVAQLAALAGKAIVSPGFVGDRTAKGRGQAAFREWMRDRFRSAGEWGVGIQWTWWHQYQEDYQTEYRADATEPEREKLVDEMGFGKENGTQKLTYTEADRILGREILRKFMAHAKLDWVQIGDLFIEGAHRANRDSYDPNTVVYDILGFYLSRMKPRDHFESTILQASSVDNAFSKDYRLLRPADKDLVTYKSLEPFIQQVAKDYGFEDGDVEHFKREGLTPSDDAAHTRRNFWTETYRLYAMESAKDDRIRLTNHTYGARIRSLSLSYKAEATGSLARENKFPWSAGEKDALVAQLVKSKHREYDWNSFANAMQTKLESEGVKNVRRTKMAIQGRLNSMQAYWMWRIFEAGGDIVKVFGQDHVQKHGGIPGLRTSAEAANRAAQLAKNDNGISYQMEGAKALREAHLGASTSNAEAPTSKRTAATSNAKARTASASTSNAKVRTSTTTAPGSKGTKKPEGSTFASYDRKGKGKAVEVRSDSEGEEESGEWLNSEDEAMEVQEQVDELGEVDQLEADEIDQLESEVDELESESEQVAGKEDASNGIKIKQYVGKKRERSAARIPTRRAAPKTLSKTRQITGQLLSTKSKLQQQEQRKARSASKAGSSYKPKSSTTQKGVQQQQQQQQAPVPASRKLNAQKPDSAPALAALAQRQALSALGSFKKRRVSDWDDEEVELVKRGPAPSKARDIVQGGPSKAREFIKSGASSSSNVGRATTSAQNQIITIDDSDSDTSSIEFVDQSRERRRAASLQGRASTANEQAKISSSSTSAPNRSTSATVSNKSTLADVSNRSTSADLRASIGYKKRRIAVDSDDDEE